MSLNDRSWERLRAGLAAGHRDGEIDAVWLARELLSEVYAANGTAHAKRRLVVFRQHAADANIAELAPHTESEATNQRPPRSAALA